MARNTNAVGFTVVRKTPDFRGDLVFIEERHFEETSDFEKACKYFSRSEAQSLLESCLPTPAHWEIRSFSVQLGGRA